MALKMSAPPLEIVGSLEQEAAVLAIGAHPDDADLNCGGTLLLESKKGRVVGIIDLTLGEAGSRGTVEIRRQEAIDAADILGVSVRCQFNFGDGVLRPEVEHSLALATALRRLRPQLVLCPYPEDKHPDHAASGQLVESALYHARMRSFDLGAPIWSVPQLVYYNQHIYRHPDVVIDVTEVLDAKMQAVRAFETQFGKPLTDVGEDYIPLGTSDYQFFAETRMRQYGSLIKASYGEGYLLSQPLAAHSILDSLA